MLFVSEPYRDLAGMGTYVANGGRTAAILVCDPGISVLGSGTGPDHAWVRTTEATYVSVYLSPNCQARVYERKVNAIEDAIREMRGNVIVAGDFNARAIEWGMPLTNSRGRLLLEMAARLDLVVANVGSVPTYRRPGYGDSIPDVTFVSAGLMPRLSDWRVT